MQYDVLYYIFACLFISRHQTKELGSDFMIGNYYDFKYFNHMNDIALTYQRRIVGCFGN
jgi:hypothetical protein